MKTVTQKDFRDLYPAPDATKIQEMRRTLAALPDRNQEMPESRENRPVLRVFFRLEVQLIIQTVLRHHEMYTVLKALIEQHFFAKTTQ